MDREAWWATVHGVTKSRTQPRMQEITQVCGSGPVGKKKDPLGLGAL